jgi:hypothetical protein
MLYGPLRAKDLRSRNLENFQNRTVDGHDQDCFQAAENHPKHAHAVLELNKSIGRAEDRRYGRTLGDNG